MRSHIAPGKFRARLNVPCAPVASSYWCEVGAAKSPEAALQAAVDYWRSDSWPGPIESASFAEVFRYLEDGEVETGPSFVVLFTQARPNTQLSAGFAATRT